MRVIAKMLLGVGLILGVIVGFLLPGVVAGYIVVHFWDLNPVGFFFGTYGVIAILYLGWVIGDATFDF